jgi:phosphopantetheinyl transferase
MVHPVEVIVSNDPHGRPRIDSIAGAGPTPSISLAHNETGAVAVAADRPVGIDLEAVDAGARLVVSDFATDDERRLLSQLPGSANDPSRVTRLWCAKEAAAKLLGTGLGGRPKQFEAVDVDRSGRLSIVHRPSGQQIEVHTTAHDGLLVAVAMAAPTPVVPGRTA